MSKFQKILVWVIVVIILIGGFLYFSRGGITPVYSPNGQNTEQTGTTTSQNTGSYKIEQVPVTGTSEMPDLNRAIVYGSNITPEAKKRATTKINEITSALKKNPAVWEDWINLGIYQKMAGDYQGTIASWLYASKISPNDYVALGNLGDLYAYFLKNTDKSIMYYNQAIAKNPLQGYLYTQLAQVYRDILGDTAKAKQTIERGLAKVPNDANLKAFLDSFSK